MNSYEYWIEDAERDHDDEDEAPERRRSRDSTLGEWAEEELGAHPQPIRSSRPPERTVGNAATADGGEVRH